MAQHSLLMNLDMIQYLMYVQILMVIQGDDNVFSPSLRSVAISGLRFELNRGALLQHADSEQNP